MKSFIVNLILISSLLFFVFSCNPNGLPVTDNDIDLPVLDGEVKIMFLHHSTGGVVYGSGVPQWFTQYNSDNSADYQIIDLAFPDAPYPWNNYPYDYWNIWINHAGPSAYDGQPTLEMLTPLYDVIIWKHCYPVSHVADDTGSPDISSSQKSQENYKLQYNALKQKMLSYPDTKFIVWTGAALVEESTNSNEAGNMSSWVNWIRTTWDVDGDNIFLWDFYQLETDDGLYLLDAHKAGDGDSHPSTTFGSTVAPLFGNRVVDVIEGGGDTGSLTGE